MGAGWAAPAVHFSSMGGPPAAAPVPLHHSVPRGGNDLNDLVDHAAARKFSWEIFLTILEEHRAPGSTRAGLRAVVLAGGAGL